MRNSCARRGSRIVRRCISLLCLTLHLYPTGCTMLLNKQQSERGGNKENHTFIGRNLRRESSRFFHRIYFPSIHQFSISAYPALKFAEVLESVPVILGEGVGGGQKRSRTLERKSAVSRKGPRRVNRLSALTPLISQLASSARLWTVGGGGWRSWREARTQEEHANSTLMQKKYSRNCKVRSSRTGRNG